MAPQKSYITIDTYDQHDFKPYSYDLFQMWAIWNQGSILRPRIDRVRYESGDQPAKESREHCHQEEDKEGSQEHGQLVLGHEGLNTNLKWTRLKEDY